PVRPGHVAAHHPAIGQTLVGDQRDALVVLADVAVVVVGPVAGADAVAQPADQDLTGGAVGQEGGLGGRDVVARRVHATRAVDAGGAVRIAAAAGADRVIEHQAL